jgi:integration host factor subunit beta
VLVPGKQVPHFKAGKELRERVDLDGNDDASSDASGDSVETAASGVGAHAML